MPPPRVRELQEHGAGRGRRLHGALGIAARALPARLGKAGGAGEGGTEAGEVRT